jgi:endonuclease IV
MSLRVGYHVQRQHDLSTDLIEHIRRVKGVIPSAIPSLQIFVAGPKSSKPITLTPDDILRVKELTSSGNLILIVHGSYLDRPFEGTHLGVVRTEMKIIKKLGGSNVIGPIIHLSKISREHGDGGIPGYIHVVFETDATRDVPTIPILVDEIATLHYPIVIDTAHIYASGIDIHDPSVMTALLARLRTKGRNRVIGFHLNDTLVECGSGIDRHETIGNGNIFSGRGGYKSLLELVRFCLSEDLFILIESPIREDEHISELQLIKKCLDEIL